jgi:RHS repeat-associated protein
MERNAHHQTQPWAGNHTRRYLDDGPRPLDNWPTLPGQSSGNATKKPDPGGESSKATATPAIAKPLLESKLPTAPTLSLPKGGGAIRGMGEKFTVNPTNATGAFSIPIKVPPGRSGMQPKLSLEYDSGTGNGEFGLGWRLSGVDSITRKTSKGLPLYNDRGSDEDADVFLLAGAEDLVPLWKRDSAGNVAVNTSSSGQPEFDEIVVDGFVVRAYSPRVISTFNRIERWTSLSNVYDVHWRVISPENVTSIFGPSQSSRINDPSSVTETVDGNGAGAARIFSWLLSETYDAHGNAIIFSYKREDSTNVGLSQAHELNRLDESRRANLYLKTIRYGNTIPNRNPDSWEAISAHSLPDNSTNWKYTVVMDYGDHPLERPQPGDQGNWPCRLDPFSRYNSGFEIRTYRLCHRILVFHSFEEELGHENVLVSSVDLSYAESPTVTYHVAAELAGYSGSATPVRKSIPPVEFAYSQFPSDDELSRLPVEKPDSESMENFPIGLDGDNYRWVDLDGEGISGILAAYKDAWYYKRNTSALEKTPAVHFSPLEEVKLAPFAAVSTSKMEFGDVNGNGRLDLISHIAGQWGYYERDEGQDIGWTEFHTFRTFPNLKSDRNMQFIDLTGDGHADILIHEDQVYTWFPSHGSAGYGAPKSCTQPWDEAEGPICVSADSEQSIYLADMSGDGMVDLCRIRNGDCCYWPQLGYGRFGRQVRFDNAPWSDYYGQFDQKRVRIIDMDGSGTADVIYVTNEGVEVYLNQSGNSFSAKKKISVPYLDSNTVFNTTDLLGNGTQCLVFSSAMPDDVARSMRYVDLFRGKKPHLMTNIKNNLGMETRIYYAPSTRFYLEDKQKGRPWITRLHFPVQCVEAVESVDLITGNKFTTSYRYAHGFYDGIEREFRGFARVDQIDTSIFAASRKDAPVAFWDVPPVHTVTWYHTGAYINNESMSKALSKEYFHTGEPNEPGQLEDTIIPLECVEGVQRMEACRALKGRALRVEVYSDDASDKSHLPYSVRETNFTIMSKQAISDARNHGIHFVHARETVSWSYERILNDPRITHEMVLEVDKFGTVRKDLKIAYGRRPGNSQLGGGDALKQETTMMLYSETDVTNDLDGKQYRAPVPCESRQYEIRGLSPGDPGSSFFRYQDMVADAFQAVLSAREIPYEEEESTGLPTRRLLQQERILFRADNLSGLLPVRRMEFLCLSGAHHKLVFTPGLFNKLFTKVAPDGSSQTLMSSSEALNGKGYVDLDGNGSLWTSSAGVSYATNYPTATVAQELAEARSSFFLPKTFVGMFGNPFFVTYDRYTLFPIRSQDALGNAVSVAMDYRALQPASITDANGNRSAAAYDGMGLMAGMAVSGKPSDNIGDTLDSFEADLSQERLNLFLANPTVTAARDLLGNATSRVLYDPWRANGTSEKPVYSAFISRETHVNFPPPLGGTLFQVQISYSDGLGRVIQVKTRTKSGPVTKDGPDVEDPWVGSGWTIFNNKGKPVKQFEPFFDTTAEFQSNMMVGFSPTLLYDPLDRAVALIRPDHAVEKTVYHPWYQKAFDANDCVLLSDPRKDIDVGHLFASVPQDEFLPSWYDARHNGGMGQLEQNAADKTVAHNDTPKVSHFDSMGRPFQVITDTGDEKITVTMDLDMLGNNRIVRDALYRKVGTLDFDMSQRQIRCGTIDSGTSWEFLDGDGQISMSWNSRDFRFRTQYDKLRRRKKSWWRAVGSSAQEVLVSEMVYGEDFSSAESDSADAHNLRGREWQVLDQSGLVEHTDYDWDGNPTRTRRKLATIYKDIFDVSEAALEDEEFITQDDFDVLDRSIRSAAPDGTITSRVYNQSTQLDRMYVNTKGEFDPQSDPSSWSPIVTDSQYNARGQVAHITYGNGTKSIRTYDEQLFRLERLRTIKGENVPVQDLQYTYDAVGNISHTRDAAQQDVFFRNTVVNASNDYSYDATYRLASAAGREHLGQTNGRPNAPVASDGSDTRHKVAGNDAGDGKAMGLYTETYKYDLAGNILSLRHAGSDAQNVGWTRLYGYDEPSLLEPGSGKQSNRLSWTSVGNTTERYRYDGDGGLTGNMTAMAHLPLMKWDFADQLKATSKQTVSQGSSQIPEMTYYVYNWHGHRIRKVTESAAGPNSRPTPTKLKERIYVDTEYEVFRKFDLGAAESEEGDAPLLELERTIFHANDVMYGHMADIHSRTQGADEGVLRQVRFQLGDHLGSVRAELDDTAQLISYEEFFPFGSTSYQAVASQTDVPKRYRFSGMELDDETGLYHMGARYYAPWLGRWTATDPLVVRSGGKEVPSSGRSLTDTSSGKKDDPRKETPSKRIDLLLNLYAYASNRPVSLVDKTGCDPVSPHTLESTVRALEASVASLSDNLSKGNARTIFAAIFESQGGKILKDNATPWNHQQNMRDTLTGVTNARAAIQAQLLRLGNMGSEGARAAKSIEQSLRPMMNAAGNWIKSATDATRVIGLINRGGFAQRFVGTSVSVLEKGPNVVGQLTSRGMSLVPEEIVAAERGFMSSFWAGVRQIPSTLSESKQAARDMLLAAGGSISAYAAAFRQAASQAGKGFMQRAAGFLQRGLPVLETFGSGLLRLGSSLISVPIFIVPSNILAPYGGTVTEA